MSSMDETRRTFTLALGAAMLSPALLEAAAQDVRRDGAISRETMAAALKLTGDPMTDERMERTRRALEMLLEDIEAVRKFAVPPGVEPVTRFPGR